MAIRSRRVVIPIEHRFTRTPDGLVWTRTQYPYRFWTRYLETFEDVLVLARTSNSERPSEGATLVTGEGVNVFPLPSYHGPYQYLLTARSITKEVHAQLRPNDALILRVGSRPAFEVGSAISRAKRPYGIEVLGDPYDVFAPGSVHHPLRPFLRMFLTSWMKAQCAKAVAAAYVNRHVLPARYPCHGFTTHYSDIDLLDTHFRCAHTDRLRRRELTLVTVGSLAQMYKGVDVLIEAVHLCAQAGLNIHAKVIGDGKYRMKLQQMAAERGLTGRVAFLGQLPAGDPVREELDSSDIFILPSRTEGLPRALIEAMARGLPCIGSAVGGIPELLPPEDMVPPGDARALARKIQEVASSPERMAAMSARNLAKAQEYRDDVLRERRIAFYRHVRERTEEWLQSQQRD